MPNASRLVATSCSAGLVASSVSTTRDDGVDDVLAVVEHDQEAARRHVLGQAGLERGAVDVGNAERRRDDRGDPLAVLERRQVDEPDAVGEGVELLARQLLRQPRLAAAADPAQRDQARVAEQPRAVGERGFAADEAGPRLRQVVWRDRRLRRAGRRRGGVGAGRGR